MFVSKKFLFNTGSFIWIKKYYMEYLCNKRQFEVCAVYVHYTVF
jgi:hypothetical protein